MSAFGANVLVDLVDALERLPAAVVVEVSTRFVEIAESEAARAGMTRVMGKYPLTAKLKSISVSGTEAEMTFVGFPAGFWVWAEEGTRAHMIRPRTRFSDSTKGRYRAAMSGGLGHPVTAPVRHPGQRGRAAWTHTVDRVDNEFGNMIDDAANHIDLWGV